MAARDFFNAAGRNRHFATLCATCSFNASFKQLLMAGEPGFGVPVLPGTPEAFIAALHGCEPAHCPAACLIPN